MVVIWAVPVVSATVGLILVLTQARKLEELSLGLGEAVWRLRELRQPLSHIRRELHAGGPLVDRLWLHWQEEHQA